MSGVAGVLLAAGRGTRFGGDKLGAVLDGVPLATHAARVMAAAPLRWRFAVVAGDAAPCGLQAIRNPDPAAGQAGSLALGVAAARAVGAVAVLVMLADMPRVTPGHVARLLARGVGPDTLAASAAGDARLPPALIGRAWFAELAALTGDRGARHLLARAVPVAADPAELVDIDTPADLAALAGGRGQAGPTAPADRRSGGRSI